MNTTYTNEGESKNRILHACAFGVEYRREFTEIISAINTLVVPVAEYSFNILNWTITDIKRNDVKTRKHPLNIKLGMVEWVNI